MASVLYTDRLSLTSSLTSSALYVWQAERQLENERAESKRKVEQVKRSMEDETSDTKRKAKEVSQCV